MSRDSSPQKNLRLDTFNIVALAVFFGAGGNAEYIHSIATFKINSRRANLLFYWLSCYFFSHFLLTFISLLQGKRNFSFLLSSSSVIRSK